MLLKKAFLAKVPVVLEFPPQMVDAVEEVLGGEYETGYNGEKLTIVDIGANVGSFTVWSSLRWPKSMIYAYEPNPQTFEYLRLNTKKIRGVKQLNKAVSASKASSELFFSRFAGDGEASLVTYAKQTFDSIGADLVFPVATIHPSSLPAADILKIDVEGAEAEIIEHLKLAKTSLLLIEYQTMKNRKKIEKLLANTFTLLSEDTKAWSALINGTGYNKKLATDYFGHLFFVNNNIEKIGKLKKLV